MKTFFFVALLICSGSYAQEVLTHEKGNLLITASLSNTLYREDYLSRIDEVARFIEVTLPTKVPQDLRDQIAGQPMKIEVTDTQAKGALFLEREKETGRLLIRVNRLYFTNSTLFRLLAHEWFHALHFIVHPDEPAWLREGLAQVFEHIALGGYSGPSLLDALDRTTTPLEYAFKLKESSPEAYGHTFLYFYYLYSKCGGQSLFWKLVRSAPNAFGRETVDRALNGNPLVACQDFETSAVHAEIARVQNRKIYKTPTDLQDLYWVIPNLSRDIELSAPSVLEPKAFETLPAYQPVVVSGSLKTKVAPLVRPGVRAFTLARQYPYTVTEGLPSGTSLDEVILILKTR